jgi:hypothetical protein
MNMMLFSLQAAPELGQGILPRNCKTLLDKEIRYHGTHQGKVWYGKACRSVESRDCGLKGKTLIYCLPAV